MRTDRNTEIDAVAFAKTMQKCRRERRIAYLVYLIKKLRRAKSREREDLPTQQTCLQHETGRLSRILEVVRKREIKT